MATGVGKLLKAGEDRRMLCWREGGRKGLGQGLPIGSHGSEFLFHVLVQGGLEMVQEQGAAFPAVLHPVEGMVDVAKLYPEEQLEDAADLADAQLAVGDASRCVQGIDELDQGILGIAPEEIPAVALGKEDVFRLVRLQAGKEVVVEELAGDDLGGLVIVVGGEMGVDLEDEAVDAIVEVDLAELEEIVVPVGPAQPVVPVEVGIVDVLLVLLLELVELVGEVLVVELAASHRAGGFDAEDLVVVDELAQYLWLDVLEELDFLVCVLEAFFQHVLLHFG